MENIKKIVVSDDESIQGEGLSQVIRGYIPDAQIYVCSNGEEAYKIISSENIDILISDIRMPIMDGIELIKKISSNNIHIKIVLISAYQEFEYARSAITYGVTEYLVKPFRREAIKNLLCKIDKELSIDIQKRKEKGEYEKILAKYHHDNKMKQLSSVLNGVVSVDKLDNTIGSTLSRKGVIVLVRWKNRLPAGGKESYLSETQQELLVKNVSAIFPDCFIVPMEKGLDIQECRVAVLAAGYAAENCENSLLQLQNELKRFNIIFWCGISDEQENLLNQMRSALQQAEDVLSYYFYVKKEGRIFSYKNMNMYLDKPMESVTIYEKEIREAIHKGSYQEIEALMKKIERKLMTPAYLSPFKVKHTISSMIVGIVKELECMVQQVEYDDILNDCYKRYGNCDSLEDLMKISNELSAQTAAYYNQETGQCDVVEDVIAYIKRHFTEDMTLQELAGRVHFSANYLSTKIKKRTGMTYTNYIMTLRIEQACRLLRHSDLKVMDIAIQCGFNDSSYFNRIFRRKYDTSPEQYRKAHKNVKEA